MTSLSQAESVKKHLLQFIQQSHGLQGVCMEQLLRSYSSSRLLQTLFEDCSQLSSSQCRLSKAYQEIGCVDRALNHGLVAARSTDLSVDDKLESLIVVARCCLEQNNFDEAKDRLEELLELLSKTIKGNDEKLLEVERMLVTCLQKKGMLQEALCQQEQFMLVCSNRYGSNSIEYALGLVEKGKLLAECLRYEEAQQHQQRAIDILITLSFNKADTVPDLYVTLAVYQRHNGNLETEYSSLVKARNIYNELLAENSCKLIDVRRSIAINLEARGRLYECLKEWAEIREMEKLVFGEITIQVGRSERMIGNMYAQLDKHIQAIKHYLRAASIFEENGERKTASELEQAIRGLRQRKPGCRRLLKSAQNR